MVGTCAMRKKFAQANLPLRLLYHTTPKKFLVNKEQENEMTQKALGNTLFSDLIKEWLDSVRAKVKPSSYAQYAKRTEKIILPYFAGKKLKDITAGSVQDFIEHLRAENFNEKYIYDVTTQLKSILKNITRSYGYPDPTVGMEMIRAGRDHEPQQLVYSEEMCERLDMALTAEPDLTKCGILMTLHTGLRIGELCALKWEDIDLEEKKITVQRGIQRISAEEGSILTITDIGRRSREVPISQFLCDILSKYKVPDNRFFLSGTTSPVEPRTMQYRLRSFLKKEHLPDISFNDLKKLFIKRCISCGTDITVLSDILGNSSVQSAAMYCEKPTITSKMQAVSLIAKEVS